MSIFQEILNIEERQEALLSQLKETWKSTADDKKSEMLHAQDNWAFRWACEHGHLEVAKWLWGICSEQEQSSMLHADDDNAFRFACWEGHLEVAKWLWKVCPDEDKKQMLHAKDNSAFQWACKKGHLEIAQWLWAICSDQEQSTMLHVDNDYAFRWVCYNGHIETAKWLWSICSEQEQPSMLHADDDYAFRWACEHGYFKLAEWLWKVCPDEDKKQMLHTQDDWAFRLACEHGHLEIAQWLWKVCPDEEQYAMLHADDDYAFRGACEYGHLELAKWLWSECKTPDKQSTMLHEDNDFAFRRACAHGHLEIAKWLWSECKTPDEQLTMLHAEDDYAFLSACESGHLEMMKWVFILYDNDVDTRLKLFSKAMAIKDGIGYVLWPCLNVIEQIQMLNQDFVQASLKKAIANNDAKDFNCVIQLVHKCHDVVKRQYNDYVYRNAFVSTIGDLVSSTSQHSMHLEYIKGCKAQNGQFFREHQMDYLLRSAIMTKEHDKINMVLSALDAEDLLASASFLEGWLTLATQEGVTDFVTCYQKALWCDGLYPLLETSKEHINDGMITIIRTLFETKACSMTSLISVINQHVSDPQYWPSICQQVIIDMIKTKGLNEDTKALFESLCEHALAPKNYFSEEDYHEIKSQLMSWYEEEAQRADQGEGLWKDKHTLSQMYGRLGIGLGITLGMTTHLATGKVAIDQKLTALDHNPRSVADFPGFSDGAIINGSTKRAREELR